MSRNTQYDVLMIELLRGKASVRVPLLLTPQMKAAVLDKAAASEQNLSDWIRWTLAERIAADQEKQGSQDGAS